MTTRTKYLLAALAVLVAFATGRWSAPDHIKIQTVEVDKKTDNKKVEDDTHKTTTITETQKPDGTKTTTTTITDNSVDKIADKSTEDDEKTTTKEIDKSSPTTLGFSAGVNPFSPQGGMIYGGQIYRPMLGPLGVGVSFLTDKTASVIVGLSF